MREAIGGSMLMYFIIPFIFLFVVFIAFVMNYASAYRSANFAVSQIETCNGVFNGCGHFDFDNLVNKLKAKYHYGDSVDISCTENGVGTVYNVTLHVSFDMPFVGRVGVYDVKSETRTLQGNKKCSFKTTTYR